jgi:hypothetical protein
MNAPKRPQPWSTLDAQTPWWTQQRAHWTERLDYRDTTGRTGDHPVYRLHNLDHTNTAHQPWSLFDPVLAELIYRWWCPEGGTIIDPFAGGPTRGAIAALTGRTYDGVDINQEQIAANYTAVMDTSIPCRFVWFHDDSANRLPGQGYDMAIMCPPYGHIERYTNHPNDLSNMTWRQYQTAYTTIIANTIKALDDNAFSVAIVSDYRRDDTKTHRSYRNLLGATINAHEAAGARYYDHAIYIHKPGTLPLRAPRQWEATRKLGRRHQHVLVFVKGDPHQIIAKGLEQWP